MADMPAYDPADRLGGAAEDFADDLAGNVHFMPRRHPPLGLAGFARNQLLGLADGGKAEFVRNIAGVVGLIHEVAAQIEGLGIEPVAGYARHAVGIVDGLHTNIADKSVEALIDDGRALIRQQPEIAIAGAVIIGFLGARMVKARS
jgi:hypothetical protein